MRGVGKRMRSSSYCEVVGDSVKVFFFQAEDGIRVLVRSRGLGDVYKRQKDAYGLASRCREDRWQLRSSARSDARGAQAVRDLSLIHI